MSAGVEQRRRSIMELVRSQGFVSTAELAERFCVSEMSIRRDAEALGSRGDVARVRGGLIPPPRRAEPAPRDEGRAPGDAKERIARAAVRRVGTDSVIMIDAGTTALALARQLPETFRGTVISHSLPVLEFMLTRPDATTIGLGGELYCRSRAFIGTAAISALERLRAETFFMGAAGVTGDGVFAARDVERNLKRTMMEACRRTVVLVEHSKFETAAPVFLAGWGPGLTVLTDRAVAAQVVTRVTGAGATVEVAEPGRR